MDSQNNLNQIDFYLTLGNTNYGYPSSSIPLDLNGVSFSLKLGVLLNQREHTDQLVPGVSGGVASVTSPIGLIRKRLRK